MPTTRIFLAFELDFESRSSSGSEDFDLVPPGLVIAESISEELKLRGCASSSPSQKEDFGWCFEIKKDLPLSITLQTLGAPRYLLEASVQISFLSWILSRSETSLKKSKSFTALNDSMARYFKGNKVNWILAESASHAEAKILHALGDKLPYSS